MTRCGQDEQVDAPWTGPPEGAFAERLAEMGGNAAMAVVAHPDDDLLFMSRFVERAVSKRISLRVVYLTAGDAGKPQAYWLGREAGVRAAYDALLQGAPSWRDQTLVLPQGSYAEWVATDGALQLSLVFLRLPDGNTKGQGYANTHRQSLRALWRNERATLDPLDGGQSYGKDRLVAALAELCADWRAQGGQALSLAALNCLAKDPGAGDHPDHHASALFAVAAFKLCAPAAGALLHWGYDGTRWPQNLSPAESARKWARFLRYAAFDPAVWSKRKARGPLPLYHRLRDREYAWDASDVDVAAQAQACVAAGATILR